MEKVFVFLADGFEEIEAISIIDVLRRANIPTQTVSITGNKHVHGAHKIPVQADILFDDADFDGAQMLVLPGGMPGAVNLDAHTALKDKLKHFHREGKYVAAICAAPLVLGGIDLLNGKHATCYPGFEHTLKGARYTAEPVTVDGKIITGKGPGFATQFALTLVEAIAGELKAIEVAKGMLLKD
ncbi:MAG: DJ-1 family glyoxalase III [Tannerellaceae bacterium]